MAPDPKGRDLFIVDNSISGWTALRYLKEWTDIAKAFDIATGYFEIGSLLALDGKWQKLEKIRILMGAETTHRTRKALLEAVRTHAVGVLDGSIEADKAQNPFLHGVPAVLEALRSGQIECRVYDLYKFHAKAYIFGLQRAVNCGKNRLVTSEKKFACLRPSPSRVSPRILFRRCPGRLRSGFDIPVSWNPPVSSPIATASASLTMSPTNCPGSPHPYLEE